MGDCWVSLVFFKAGAQVSNTVIIYSIVDKGGMMGACKFKWLQWVVLGGFMLLFQPLVETRGVV